MRVPAFSIAFGPRAATRHDMVRLVLFCLAPTLVSDGVLCALEPMQPVVQFSQKVWRVEEGLPENFARVLKQTRDGYLWIGTQEGLVRFDGLRMKVFNTRNTPQLRSNAIVTLCEDRGGTLWIGTDGGGIARYRQGRFLEPLTTRDGLGHNYIRDLHAAPDGAVWITAHNGGLIRMQGQQMQRWTMREGLPSDSLRTVLMDSSGRLWIGADEAGLSVLENGVFRHLSREHGIAGSEVRVLYEDRSRRIWIGTRDDGLYRFEAGVFRRFTTAQGLPANSVRSLVEDRDGVMWVGLESGGLARYCRDQFEVLDTTRGLPHNFVRALLEDSEGNLWVGTRGGLMRLRERALETWTTTEGLIDDNVKSVFADSSGSLWAGTATGLNVIRGGRIQAVRLSNHPSQEFVRAIAQSRDGAMWFGADRGLFRLYGRSVRHYRNGDGLPDERVRALAQDVAGRIWVGTLRGLAVLSIAGLAPASALPGIGPETGLDSAHVVTLAAGPDGDMWIGTGDGLWRYSGGQIERFTSEHGLPHNNISALHFDRRRTLWVGTRGGLSRITGNRFIAFTHRDGLLSDNVLQVLDDGHNSIWLSTPRGVSRLDLAQLDRFARGEITSLQPVSFDAADGMKSAQSSGEGQPAGTRAPDGRLWFPTIHGLVVLNPPELRQQGSPPRLLVEEVRAGKLSFPGGSSAIVLPAGAGDLEVHFTAISFGAPERIRFRYRLEGFDPGWVDAESRREAYYTNLPPGEYRFRVSANPYNGSWPDEEISQQVTLRPHFYQQAWFFAASGGTLLMLVMLGYRARIRGIQRRFDAVLAERARIAREIHDTLMQGVTGISLQLEASSRQLLAAPEQAKERIDSALERLDGTLAEARECILELRRAEAQPRNLVASLREMAEQLTRGLPLTLNFEVRGNEQALPPTQQEQILRIAREAVTNTTAHAAAARLKISLAFEPHCFRFAARDDGRGFEPEAVEGSRFGLTGMRERARAIGALLEVHSSPGAGTEVVLSLPVRARS
jgi:ligand-binding sensor domain-containing protein/signal transduction histidine kinase